MNNKIQKNGSGGKAKGVPTRNTKTKLKLSFDSVLDRRKQTSPELPKECLYVRQKSHMRQKQYSATVSQLGFGKTCDGAAKLLTAVLYVVPCNVLPGTSRAPQ